MKILVRKASKGDTSSILELLYEMGRPKPKNNSEKVRFNGKITRYLLEPDKKILVAVSNSQIVGLVSIVFLQRLNQTKLEMYIPELVVAKKYHRQGIGKSLINACIKMAKKNKCYRIRLESGYQRKAAHLFYKRLGFEQRALTYTLKI
ncbi:MAG: GNAT family N-acetyltransferase [Thermoproteota archaeon]